MTPLFLLDTLFYALPVLTTELVHSLLVCFEIVGLVLVSVFENLMRSMPVFGYAYEVVHVEVDGRNMLTVEQTRRVFTLFLFLQQRERPVQAFRELARTNQFRRGLLFRLIVVIVVQVNDLAIFCNLYLEICW